jgi:hypothetical protein
MRELCHRCHHELPETFAGSSRGDEDALLFCPRCGAPQLCLPEHMRADVPEASRSTGALPPPRPDGLPAGQVNWRAAFLGITLVAGIEAALAALAAAFPPVAFLLSVWTLAGGILAVRLYARARPGLWLDARTGMRIGIAAGVLLIAASGVALAAAGVVQRFGTHSLARYDQELAEQRRQIQAKGIAWFDQQVQDKDLQAKYAAQVSSPSMNSPEVLAGSALFGRGLEAFFVLLFSAGGGALAGTLRTSHSPRANLRRG